MNESLPWINLDILTDSYKELAQNNVVLVGKSSFATHKYLRGAITYVYTTDELFEETDTVKRISGTAEEVINKIKEENADKDIVIGGGGTVFKTFYDLIDAWRVTFINESVVFNRDVDMTDIQHKWNKRQLLSAGTDNNKEFEVWHLTK